MNNTIIQEKATNVVIEFLEKVYEIFREGSNFTKTAEEISNNADILTCELMSEYMNIIDDTIRESGLRKKSYIIKNREDEKSIITKMGEVKYKRTYYEAKDGSGYTYLLDEIMGIEKHQRIDDGFKNELLKKAIKGSYQSSGKEAGRIEVSRQTVKNIVHEIDNEEIRYEEEIETKREKKVIYVDADEDHVAMQDGKSKNVKLLYVYEGKEKIGKNRNRLIKKHYISGMTSTQGLWEEVLEYIKNTYEMKGIERIYIQGDGAKWIKSGLNIIPMSRYVLDLYHLNKYIIQMTREKEEYRDKIWWYINRADYEGFKSTVKELIEKTEDESKKTKIRDCTKYILNNWEGIQIYSEENENMIGCSAEGHISHVLSDRLSSRPLGWSLKGAENMAKLRAYRFNGGSIKELRGRIKAETEIKEQAKYKYLFKKASKGMADKYNNIEVLNNGKIGWEYKILKSLRGLC